ncbi:MAG: phosphatase PAP2 family protein [Candidatus Zixiibacteriota bacterium]|nr:MAG: phosphatase PAP2 family protein [candidate division Zixibacteria bacterium]
MTMRPAFGKTLYVLLVLYLIAGLPSAGSAEDYLDSDQIALISLGTAGTALTGRLVRNVDSARSPWITGPLPLESRLQRLLGGECYAGKTNFLDNTFGSVATPVAAGMLMLTADLSWPQGDRTKTSLQDLFLYSTGLLVTEGVTYLSKGLFARERPLPRLHADIAALRKEVDISYDRQSFFSGHTSGAFFAAAFVNKRLRSIMRTELSDGEYRNWRWASPVLMYGWASFVGWSRIHAYKHYVSDILAGALAGYLLAELFYSFGDDAFLPEGESGSVITLSITVRF